MLQLAVAGYLARFKAISRTHAESDLRAYLTWCADHRLDPLTASRPQVELYMRWMQEIRRFKPSTVSRRMSIVAGFYRTAVIDSLLEHSPAEHVRRPTVPAESPTLGLTHLQLEALLTAARQSPNRNDFALVCLLGLLGLRIFEATGTDIADLGEEHGHRVLRVVGKGGKTVLIPLPPAVSRALDHAIGDRTVGPILLNTRAARMDRHAATRRLRTLAATHADADAAAAPAHAPPHLRHHHARRRRRPPRRPNRRPPRRPSDDDALRPSPQPTRPPPQLHPRRLHGLRHLTPMIVILLVGLVALTELRALQVMLVRRGDRSLSRGSVAFVGPGRWRSGLAEEAERVRRPRAARPHVDRSAFAGFRFPPEVIMVAVRWYLRYGLSYRDVEELLAERGVEVDHVTVYRWVQRFTPLFADAARPLRHATGDRWFVDETYVKVAGRWRYLYRAVDQYGQVIDVLLSEQRDTAAARRFFTRALTSRAGAGRGDHRQGRPVPAASSTNWSRPPCTSPSSTRNNRDRSRSRPAEGPAAPDARTANASDQPHVIAAGHAFVQNLRRGHYELATDVPAHAPPRGSVHRARGRGLSGVLYRAVLARSD